MVLYKQAEFLLDGLGIKNQDLLPEAQEAVTNHGGYKQAIRESMKHEFLNGTKLLLKLCEEDKSKLDLLARENYNYFYSLAITMRDIADKNHVIYNDFCETCTIKLIDERMKQTAICYGGKSKIIKIGHGGNSDYFVSEIKKAIIRADRILANSHLAIENKSFKRLQIKGN